MSSENEQGKVQRFVKKPVEVEAVQFTEEIRNAHLFDGAPLPEGLILIRSHRHPATRTVFSATFGVRTLEGTMTANVGDWIIKGIKGEFYPCKPDIFAATYEPALPKEDTKR